MILERKLREQRQKGKKMKKLHIFLVDVNFVAKIHNANKGMRNHWRLAPANTITSSFITPNIMQTP
jgi:hypothetical protein